jgi:hypothetical protein
MVIRGVAGDVGDETGPFDEEPDDQTSSSANAELESNI